ncbi:hypothetical protein LEP48_03220 [Isoptericola sp. NEAU-Y5]|uniref:Uncharacterized protein n=1 Tax=Isoptericola luteus TaxID=2879484 RepID=A0ABS7ZD30_9MICO|nr:hypothetical protein [Isoptericola sp. NEAU-Y5]MCA5892362.1 hypothetical protein [Isoptericola sp. NEAU-Y5]
MSTVPEDGRRDAGLDDPDETSLLDEATGADPDPDPDAARDGEYRPAFPRPDLDGAASEADVVEQSRTVPGADEDDLGAGADDA